MDSLLFLIISDIVVYIGIYLIVVIALNLEYGCTGIPNIGLSFSVASGALTVGYLMGRIAMSMYSIDSSLDFVSDNSYVCSLINAEFRSYPLNAILLSLVTMLIAIIFSVFISLVAAYPAIRLRADYLMMTLIAMAEAIRIVGNAYTPIAGGTLGVQVPDIFSFFGSFRYMGATVIILVTCIAVFVIAEKITRSPFGRLLRAVRENEVSVESVGKSVNRIRIKVLALGSAIAALAGVLYSFYFCAVVAQAYNRTDWSFWPWLIMMVGGTGNNRGAALGTIIVIIARRMIIFSKYYFTGLLPFDVIWLEPILLGVSLILIMAFKPQGILPEKP
jgi:branched-chain amino acid transport system permease protein